MGKLKEKELKKLDYANLKDLLESAHVLITFEKQDGSLRDINCTLHSSKLPPLKEETETKKKRKVNHEVIPVWDLDKQSWRSFRIDSIVNSPIVVSYYE